MYVFLCTGKLTVLMLRGDDKSIREMSPLGGDDRTESCMFWPTEQY